VDTRPAKPIFRHSRRSPSWGRIAATLVGVFALFIAGLWATGLGVSRAVSPTSPAATTTVRPAARAVAGSVAAASANGVKAKAKVASSGSGAASAKNSAHTASAGDSAVAKTATAKPAATRTSTKAAAAGAGKRYIVVIDAGHQARADNHQEPIGPGATQTKPAVASGTEGVVTHNPENVINLDVSLMLRDVLAKHRDVKVVMIRTTPNVDIPNSERAKIANRLRADLLIRVHCDGVNDHSVHGLLTMVPAKDRWTGPILSASARAGRIVQNATLKTTGAHDRGILPVSNMSGFNWSKVPSVIVEMAVMTNPTDDRLLATRAYQHKLAQGMADGVVAFLHSK
jgi:N-acetylmuramoyl-L-alanine amidase